MEERQAAPVSIRRVLDKELCRKLVQSSSLTIGCNVLITDERGYVVASDRKEREDTLHEASIEVIESGQTAYHDEAAAQRLAGTMPGMTIPLLMEGHVIGTIGITGVPQEVSRYAVLVQQMTQIFMSFQNRQQSSAWMDHRQQTLLREIITFDGKLRQPSEVYSAAYEMGVDLKLPRAAILVKSLSRPPESAGMEEQEAGERRIRAALEEFFSGQNDFICAQSDTEFVVLACLPEGPEEEGIQALLERCGLLEERLREERDFQIGVGAPANGLESLRRSYEDACFTVRVIQTGVRQESCLSIRELSLERLAASLPEEVCTEAERILPEGLFLSARGGEVLELIDHWCRLRFHFTRTAEALHIHKSTLVYRFQRIQEIYGLDLYDFQRVMAVFLLSLRRRLS